MATIVPTVEYLRKSGKKAYLCAIDIDKAYDSVDRHSMV
jgi:hypothetical protein